MSRRSSWSNQYDIIIGLICFIMLYNLIIFSIQNLILQNLCLIVTWITWKGPLLKLKKRYDHAIPTNKRYLIETLEVNCIQYKVPLLQAKGATNRNAHWFHIVITLLLFSICLCLFKNGWFGYSTGDSFIFCEFPSFHFW